NVTIAPGATVAYLHFGVQESTRAGAQAAAERLVQLPPEALAGLTPDELSEVRNFAMPPLGLSTLAPLALNGTVTGRVLAFDGVTVVPYAQVLFKSNNLLFGNTQYAFANNLGEFTLTTELHDFGSKVVPIDGFTLTA